MLLTTYVSNKGLWMLVRSQQGAWGSVTPSGTQSGLEDGIVLVYPWASPPPPEGHSDYGPVWMIELKNVECTLNFSTEFFFIVENVKDLKKSKSSDYFIPWIFLSKK